MVGRGAIGRPAVFGEIKVGLGWMERDDLPWIAAHDGDWMSWRCRSTICNSALVLEQVLSNWHVKLRA